MTAYLLLPYYFFIFWFVDAPKDIIGFFLSVNKAFFQLFSLPLLLRTFFQPIKNEYRKGLVGFSIGMGIGVKSILIIVNFILLIPLLAIEVALLLAFIAFPFVTFGIFLI